MRLTAVLAILLTVLVVLLAGVILVNERVVTLNGIQMSAVLSTPEAKQGQVIAAVALLILWAGMALIGLLVLMRKGAFARPIRGLAKEPWLGCFAMIFLWWTLFIVVIPGPFLLRSADTRRGLRRCPECRGWVPPGSKVCPDCGAPVGVGGGAEAAALPEAVPRGCAVCGSETAPGALYTYYYGNLKETEQTGDMYIHRYRVGGSESVFLCHACLARHVGRSLRRRLLVILLVVAGVVLLLWAAPLLIPRGTEPIAPPTLAVFAGILLLMVLFLSLRSRRDARRHPELWGDALALSLRKPVRQREGYTEFFTREQYQALARQQ